MVYKVKDISLKDAGKKKIQWAEDHMPVLKALKEQNEKQMPLKGLKIAGAIHVTKETAVLIRTLKALGAQIAWSGCNPLSTQDDVA
ncbi:MAG TPA: adenosylhomocysteinase, partial [Nanoarchaeota archaeon]|nr:adenosylhomocysteinase [Nanoarchaeota archaeon]